MNLHQSLIITITSILTCLPAHAQESATDFSDQWNNTPDRIWIGPEFWANPMEDWRIEHGRLQSTHPGPDRNVHLLTRELSAANQPFNISVTVTLKPTNAGAHGSAGFRIAARDEIDDYRAAALRGQGIDAGITTTGTLFIADKTAQSQPIDGAIQLELHGKPAANGYTLHLRATSATTNQLIGELILDKLDPAELTGNLALFQNAKQAPGEDPPSAHTIFQNWHITGPKITRHDDRAFGPTLWAMHTLSDNVLKLTAQMPPIGADDTQSVVLQIHTNNTWQTVGRSTIDPLSRTATFRVADWNATRDIPYRLNYDLLHADGSTTAHHYDGTIRREPLDRDVILAGFTGNTDFGFPNLEVARHVAVIDPDILFFSGDQIYEHVGGYGISREPTNRAVVNYLRKWYLLGWAFGDLMRDRITVCLPDDHDVYQGNIWGNGGNSVPSIREHNDGGYVQSADFVNAVHRTQTSHHPDLPDPAPIKQGITPLHNHLRYGRVSFAIIADRMFKSGPTQVATWTGRPDHVRDPNFDPNTVDKPGLKLLGDRQLRFLRNWASDWRNADLKCVLSQTIFVNLANYHGGNRMFLIADLDSNGWPQTGRNAALAEMRKAFALHVAGDQHLPSIVTYGIDDWNDAGNAFCVPSIAAGYPRRWIPDEEGRPVQGREPGGLANTGEYLDGFHNHMTVHAIGNPEEENRPGRIKTLHDKASGFGIVRFHKDRAAYTIECWRLLVDVNNPKPDDQFPGWPKTFNLLDNYGRTPTAYLPRFTVKGTDRPVWQVINESTGELVYALRTLEPTFQPWVFQTGRYTLIISDPDRNLEQRIENLTAHRDKGHAAARTIDLKRP